VVAVSPVELLASRMGSESDLDDPDDKDVGSSSPSQLQLGERWPGEVLAT
jgi:hypothetical protein